MALSVDWTIPRIFMKLFTPAAKSCEKNAQNKAWKFCSPRHCLNFSFPLVGAQTLAFFAQSHGGTKVVLTLTRSTTHTFCFTFSAVNFWRTFLAYKWAKDPCIFFLRDGCVKTELLVPASSSSIVHWFGIIRFSISLYILGAVVAVADGRLGLAERKIKFVRCFCPQTIMWDLKQHRLVDSSWVCLCILTFAWGLYSSAAFNGIMCLGLYFYFPANAARVQRNKFSAEMAPIKITTFKAHIIFCSINTTKRKQWHQQQRPIKN